MYTVTKDDDYEKDRAPRAIPADILSKIGLPQPPVAEPPKPLTVPSNQVVAPPNEEPVAEPPVEESVVDRMARETAEELARDKANANIEGMTAEFLRLAKSPTAVVIDNATGRKVDHAERMKEIKSELHRLEVRGW
jgi:hypothetical protein